MSISILGFDFKKATQALNFFATKEGGKINKMKVLKLIWLSERLHLRIYGRPIVNDVYFAMKLGPVPSVTKNIVEGVLEEEWEIIYRNTHLSLEGLVVFSKAFVQENVFSKTDIDVMNKVYSDFHKYDQFELSDISHKYPEWKKFQSLVENGGRYQMNYADFFLNPTEDNDTIFNQEEEFLSDSQEYFKGIC